MAKLKAKILSIIEVKDKNVMFPCYALRFRVRKKVFLTYIGSKVNNDTIRTAIKMKYEEKTLAAKKQSYKNSLPGLSVEFESEV